MAEEASKEILNLSQEETEKILQFIPDLKLIEERRAGIIPSVTIKVQALKSAEAEVLELFLLEVTLRDRRGPGAKDRLPTFYIPIRRSLLIALAKSLLKEVDPPAEDPQLSLLREIRDSIPGLSQKPSNTSND